MSKPQRILMLAFPDCQMLDVTGPLQMFAGVNDELGRQAYELVIAAPKRGPFKTSSGVSLVANLAIADLSPARCRTSDTLIAVGGDPGLRHALESKEIATNQGGKPARVPYRFRLYGCILACRSRIA